MPRRPELHDARPTLLRADRPGAGSEHVFVPDLLVEPQVKTGQWLPALVRRLAVLSTGPACLGAPDDLARERLERAGVPILGRDADPRDAFAEAWPHLPELRTLACGYGNPAADLVLVADRITRAAPAPLASRSGTWLFAALRSLGWDELRCYVANARDLDGARRTGSLARLRDLLPAARFVALGREAEKVLAQAGIPCGYAPHPSGARRWKYDEGAAGYAEGLVAAGVPRLGPDPTEAWRAAWGADDLPEHEDAPRRNPAWSITSTAYRPTARGEGAPRERAHAASSKADPALVERARQVYVGQKVRTLADAATFAGLGLDEVQEAARAQNWVQQRAEQARRTTEAALEAAREVEAKALANSRRLAWHAVERGLASVVEQLQSKGDDRLRCTPNQAEALARTALMLSGAEIDAGLAPRQAEVEALDLGSLLKAAQEELEKLEGGGA